MAEIVRAIILGIVQGLTEFLPVSSSGHLEITRFLMRDPSLAEHSLLLTVIVHFATALSTIYVFRRDIADILSGLVQREWNEAKRFSLFILLSMMPAALAGFFMEPVIESMFNQRIAFVGAMLLVTALLLFMADRARLTDRDVDGVRALLIGLAQAVAIIPGISRSGATIATSVLLGVDRYRASRFSFLMVVPLILGKMAYDIFRGDVHYTSEEFVPVALAFVAAFVSGALACRWMVRLVQRSQLSYFAMYCLCIGIFAIVIARL